MTSRPRGGLHRVSVDLEAVQGAPNHPNLREAVLALRDKDKAGESYVALVKDPVMGVLAGKSFRRVPVEAVNDELAAAVAGLHRLSPFPAAAT